MFIDFALILLGLVLLVAGGEALVRGASGVALIAKVSPAVVGLTIVAAGTSMPELVVSVQSAFRGVSGLALGNVVGSNVFNIGCILGITAMVAPLAIQGNTVRLEWPIMMLASFQMFLLARDGTIDRLEGLFLFAALVAFIAYAVWVGRRNATAAEKEEFEDVATASFGRKGRAAVVLNVLAIVVGIGALAGGSTALVSGSVSIAEALGVSDTIIGLTVVAMGTSTPELATCVVAARRGQADIAVGNVIGSNIFNVLGILGVTATILPLPVPGEIIARDTLWMLGFSLVMFPLMKSGMRVTRGEGFVLFAGFAAYMVLLVLAATGAVSPA
jgi:cation:H+ antiporter